MKVIALENVRHEGKLILKGEPFEHSSPEQAIKLNLVKQYEEAEDSGDVEPEKTVRTGGKRDRSQNATNS